MSDNYIVKTTAGNKTFDAKDIGSGVLRPRVLIAEILAGAWADMTTLLATASSIDSTLAANLPVPGQEVMANSLPVVLPSDQTPIPVYNAGPSWTQAILATSSADITAIADISPAPASGEHLVMESVTISAAVAMIVTLKEETSLTIVKVFNLTAGNLNAEWNPANGLRLPTADKKLRAISNTAGQVDISVISHSAV